MALIESVFKRASDDRVLAFQTIAEETKVPVEEVEFLIMKALSCVTSRPCLSSLLFITADDRLSPLPQPQAHPWLDRRHRADVDSHLGSAASARPGSARGSRWTTG
jgi:hypothetical protein